MASYRITACHSASWCFSRKQSQKIAPYFSLNGFPLLFVL
jgi:hypothetical protein